LDYHTEYKYYGCEVLGNIIALNFPGTSDWCYGIVISNEEIKTNFKDNLDEYPIYFIDFECCEIDLAFNNFSGFVKKFYPDYDCTILSDKYVSQEIPIIRRLSKEQRESPEGITCQSNSDTIMSLDAFQKCVNAFQK
jgi:hypothetical protein